MTIFRRGYTYRTQCGQGRATYEPHGASVGPDSRPWLVVVRGTVVCRAPTLYSAKQILGDKYRLDTRE